MLQRDLAEEAVEHLLHRRRAEKVVHASLHVVIPDATRAPLSIRERLRPRPRQLARHRGPLLLAQVAHLGHSPCAEQHLSRDDGDRVRARLGKVFQQALADHGRCRADEKERDFGCGDGERGDIDCRRGAERGVAVECAAEGGAVRVRGELQDRRVEDHLRLLLQALICSVSASSRTLNSTYLVCLRCAYRGGRRGG